MSLKNPDYKNILFHELAFTQEKMYQLKEKDINLYEKGFWVSWPEAQRKSDHAISLVGGQVYR